MVQPAIRARLKSREADQRAVRRAAVRPTLPVPIPIVAMIALALCEVEAGLRSIEQLERVCHPSLWPSLETRVRRRGGPPVSANSLLRVRVQEVDLSLVEAVAVMRRGSRVEAIAMRLDGAEGHWEIVELQY